MVWGMSLGYNCQIPFHGTAFLFSPSAPTPLSSAWSTISDDLPPKKLFNPPVFLYPITTPLGLSHLTYYNSF